MFELNKKIAFNKNHKQKGDYAINSSKNDAKILTVYYKALILAYNNAI